MFNKITIYLLLVVGLRKLNIIRVTKKCLLVVTLVTNLSVTHFREIRYQRFIMTLLIFILVSFWFYLLHSYTYIYYSYNQSPTQNANRWNTCLFKNQNICTRFVETIIVHWDFVDYAFWYLRSCVVVRASVQHGVDSVEKTRIRTKRATSK